MTAAVPGAVPAAAPAASSSVAGLYFDGRSSIARPVRLEAESAGLLLTLQDTGEQARVAARAVQVSERLNAAPRLLTFADGSHVEVRDHGALDALLATLGHADSWVVRWQRHWPAALAGLIAVVAVLWAGYTWGLPWGAELLAQRVPAAVEERIGREAAAIVEKRLFKPSQLAPERQAALRESFEQLAAGAQSQRTWRVEFRLSPMGPNAVALPGGLIIVTDDLVKLAPSDEAILAVLAHELGHVEQRHFLRRLISSAVVGAVVAMIAGDASGVVTAVPATLASLAYSRDMEREADQYAVALLLAAGRSPEPLAQMLEALEAAHQRRPSSTADKRTQRDMSDYLMTHPATAERIDAIRKAR